MLLVTLSFFSFALIFSLISPPVYAQPAADSWNIHRQPGNELNFYYSTNGIPALQLNTNGQMQARLIRDLDSPTNRIIDPSNTSTLNLLTLVGTLTGTNGNFSGAISAATGTFSGNVGIGTASPTTLLHVSGGTTGSYVSRIQHTGSSSVPGTALQVSNGYALSGGNYEIFGVYGNNFATSHFSVRDNGNTYIRGFNDGDGILFYSPASDKLGIQTILNNQPIGTYGEASHTLALQPSEGRVGIGTTSPQAKFHISGFNDSDGLAFYSPGNDTLAIQTTLNNSAPTTTPGGDSANRLALQPVAGNVGIGTTNPGAKLHVIGATSWSPVQIENNLNVCGQWSWGCVVRQMEFYAFNTWVGEVTSTNLGTVYGNASDYRLKENIRPVKEASALEAVLKIPVRRYNYKNRPDSDSMGFVAHELQQYAPYAVAGNKDQVDNDGKPVYQSVDYGRVTPLLTASVQELNKKIEAQQAQINDLINTSQELKKQNSLLKALLCNKEPHNKLCQ